MLAASLERAFGFIDLRNMGVSVGVAAEARPIAWPRCAVRPRATPPRRGGPGAPPRSPTLGPAQQLLAQSEDTPTDDHGRHWCKAEAARVLHAILSSRTSDSERREVELATSRRGKCGVREAPSAIARARQAKRASSRCRRALAPVVEQPPKGRRGGLGRRGSDVDEILVGRRQALAPARPAAAPSRRAENSGPDGLPVPPRQQPRDPGLLAREGVDDSHGAAK